MSNAAEKSCKARTDMLSLLRERNRSLTTFRRAVSVLLPGDMLIEKYCKDFVS